MFGHKPFDQEIMNDNFISEAALTLANVNCMVAMIALSRSPTTVETSILSRGFGLSSKGHGHTCFRPPR
jgi:hypothetical protein